MGTFLTTPRMSPELAARVEAAVSGRAVRVRRRLSPRWVMAGRAAALSIVVGIVVLGLVFRHSRQNALEASRRTMLQKLESHAALLDDRQRSVVVRAGALLATLAGPYEGDRLPDELRSREALGELLTRPTVYVRGPLVGFAETGELPALAEASHKDAFLLCLIEPPAERTEKNLRSRARAAMMGGARAARMAHVERLHSALVGLALLSPGWIDKVRGSSDAAELDRLRDTLLHAPLDEAVRAAKARSLLVVMDEPKENDAPTELDGAYPHHARVTLVDLAGDTPIFRVRRHIDPEWIGMESRIQYSSGIIGCELALEVRAALTGVPAPRR